MIKERILEHQEEKKVMERAEILVDTIGIFYPHKFHKLHFMIETKIATSFSTQDDDT